MKIVLTGASRGIGRHLALTLATEHKILGIARDESALQDVQREAGAMFYGTSCDVSSWSSLQSIVESVSEVWSDCDALICCAGIVTPIGKAMTQNPELWARSLRTNLDGTFFSIRAFYDLLASSERRAKVICFSGGGATEPRENFSAYGVAKAAVVRLVETLSVEWVNENIDINALAPGAITTGMTDAVIEAGREKAGETEFAGAQQQLQKRWETEALTRVSDLVSYLLSPASDCISGKLISAVWDPWRSFDGHKTAMRGSDIFTLRRIVPSDRGLDW